MTIPSWLARCVGLLFVLLLLPADNRADAETLQQKFNRHDPASTATVDHSAWNALLRAHLVPGNDGLNRFDYAGLKARGAPQLKTYLSGLQSIDPTKLGRDEQLAFWTNLYNAKTVEIVASHYPVKSIRDIRLSNILIAGPWRAKVVKVQGVPLSLDDIEHQIMRPIWRDARIHYAVNCASVGCPNLLAHAYTGAQMDAMLDEAARQYINSRRGVKFVGRKAIVSSIYDWYAEDFGGSADGVLAHIRRHAGPNLAARIKKVTTIAGYAYDWALNDTR